MDNEPNVKTPDEGRNRNALGLNKVFICWNTILFCANYIYYIYICCVKKRYRKKAVFLH